MRCKVMSGMIIAVLGATTGCSLSSPGATQSPPEISSPSTSPDRPVLGTQQLPRQPTKQSVKLRSAAMSAEVPRACGLPRQRLDAGHTTKGAPGRGQVEASRAAFADFARQGDAQALVTYSCTFSMGERSFLLLINDKGELIGDVDLASIGKTEDHYVVTGFIGILPRSAEIAWDSYQGSARSDLRHHRATVTYTHGRLHLRDRIVSYTPDAVVSDLLESFEHNERWSLRDRGVISRKLWKILADIVPDESQQGECNSTGVRAQCTFLSILQGMSATAITTVAMVKDSTNAYGWRITDYYSWVD